MPGGRVGTPLTPRQPGGRHLCHRLAREGRIDGPRVRPGDQLEGPREAVDGDQRRPEPPVDVEQDARELVGVPGVVGERRVAVHGVHLRLDRCPARVEEHTLREVGHRPEDAVVAVAVEEAEDLHLGVGDHPQRVADRPQEGGVGLGVSGGGRARADPGVAYARQRISADVGGDRRVGVLELRRLLEVRGLVELVPELIGHPVPQHPRDVRQPVGARAGDRCPGERAGCRQRHSGRAREPERTSQRPSAPVPVGRTPVGPVPVGPTPVEPTPVGPTPVGPRNVHGKVRPSGPGGGSPPAAVAMLWSPPVPCPRRRQIRDMVGTADSGVRDRPRHTFVRPAGALNVACLTAFSHRCREEGTGKP